MGLVVDGAHEESVQPACTGHAQGDGMGAVHEGPVVGMQEAGAESRKQAQGEDATMQPAGCREIPAHQAACRRRLPGVVQRATTFYYMGVVFGLR